MREIEFRAWNTQEKRYYYGVEHAYDYTVGCSKTGDFIPATTFGEIAECDGSEWIPEQYTGLKDKNGTKIYEGDICQIRTSRKHGHVADELVILGSVEFGGITIADNSLYTFNAFHIKGRSIEYELTHKLEVIGNIHENPELLEQIKNKEQ